MKPPQATPTRFQSDRLNGDFVVRTALAASRCAEFEDILSPWDVYCLVALTAYHSGYMGVCSR